MQAYQSFTLSVANIEVCLLTMALSWYASFYKLFTSGNNIFEIPMGWLVFLAFGPGLSAALGFALDRKLKTMNRPMRFLEILLVVFVTPQFLGVVYVWWGLIHYM